MVRCSFGNEKEENHHRAPSVRQREVACQATLTIDDSMGYHFVGFRGPRAGVQGRKVSTPKRLSTPARGPAEKAQIMVTTFRGDEEVEVKSAKEMFEAAESGKGDVRLKGITTASKKKEDARKKSVTIEVPNPQPASILKRKRDPLASSSTPKSPLPTTPKRKPEVNLAYRTAPLAVPQQPQRPTTPTTPKNRGNLLPDPNSVRQQTRGMTCRERRRFNFSRRGAEVTTMHPQGSVASPAPKSKVVVTATMPSQTRVQEG